MKLTAFLISLFVVKCLSLRCNQNFECNGNQEKCDAFRNIIVGDSNGQIQQCEADEDNGVVFFLID